MAVILLSQGKSCVVDDEDLEELNKFNWYAHKTVKGRWYVYRMKLVGEPGPLTTVKMHRQLL